MRCELELDERRVVEREPEPCGICHRYRWHLQGHWLRYYSGREGMHFNAMRAAKAVVDVSGSRGGLTGRPMPDRRGIRQRAGNTDLITIKRTQAGVRQVGRRPEQQDHRDERSQPRAAPPMHDSLLPRFTDALSSPGIRAAIHFVLPRRSSVKQHASPEGHHEKGALLKVALPPL